jgi:hypothetical protein
MLVMNGRGFRSQGAQTQNKILKLLGRIIFGQNDLNNSADKLSCQRFFGDIRQLFLNR